MALEKFIYGKVDDAHHDGRYANQKRLEEAILSLTEGEQIMASMMVWRQRDAIPGMDEGTLMMHQSILEDYGLLVDGELVI